jgi:hypothetical protein
VFGFGKRENELKETIMGGKNENIKIFLTIENASNLER